MIKRFKNRKSIVAALSVGILLLIAEPAHAFIGTGIFDWAMSAMGGLSDLGALSLSLFFGLFIALSLSSALVAISAVLLEWAIQLPIEVIGNPIVETGWGFTLGIANMFLILILVGIALAFILKMETFGMKKALPRLIIIALVVNFSLLLVGMFADVASILGNTILQSIGGEEGLAQNTLTALTGGTKNLTTPLLVLLTSSIALLAIPLVDVFTMMARIGFSLVYLPNLISGFFLVFFNIIIGIIYLFYFVLFVARIVVFWLLAIFAPLAFLAAILPATEKYWKDWLHKLLEWTFLGVIALFLMALGLRVMGTFIGGVELTINPAEGWNNLRETLAYYFFVAIYLVISLIVAKKFAPKSAKVVVDAIERGGKAAGKLTALRALGGFTGMRQSIAGRMKREAGTYQWLREGGMGRREALRETTRRSLLSRRQKLWPKQRMGAKARIKRIAGAVGITGAFKGVSKAAWDIAKAGTLAGLGIKTKKSGLRKAPCPGCGKTGIAASAKQCPGCGYSFE